MMRMRLKPMKALLGLKMSNKIRSILSDIEKQKFATSTGKQTHAILQYYSGSNTKNLDNELYKKFSTNKELDKFFCADSKAEVPVAGYINGRFVSRRIDRLATNHDDKTVYILDYKTDSDKNVFHDKYVATRDRHGWEYNPLPGAAALMLGLCWAWTQANEAIETGATIESFREVWHCANKLLNYVATTLPGAKE